MGYCGRGDQGHDDGNKYNKGDVERHRENWAGKWVPPLPLSISGFHFFPGIIRPGRQTAGHSGEAAEIWDISAHSYHF